MAIGNKFSDITSTYIDITVSVLLIVFVVILTSLCIKKFKKLHKVGVINSIEYKLIIRLLWLYFCLEIPFSLIGLFRYEKFLFVIERFVLIPIQVPINIIPVYIAVFLFYKRYISPSNKLTTNGNAESLNDSVKKLFKSSEFYNALSTVLPRGEKDEDYGLDYIPFMLHDLGEKRKRYGRSSNNFLIATIFLSVVFISITILFGYILLNESSIGVYKEFRELKDEVKHAGQVFSALKVDVSSDEYFLNDNEQKLDKLLETYKYNFSDDETKFKYQVQNAISDFRVNGDVDSLQQILEAVEDSLGGQKSNNLAGYLDILHTTNSSISKYIRFRSESMIELEKTQASIKELIPQIATVLDKPVNTQNELIKRLILSIVVITFFLAILRYFRGLYQTHYNEMLKAEQQDLLIRKFYVTFKSSEGNTEERKIVLASFLAEVNDSNNKKDVLKTRSKRIENDVLKDIVDAILKKI